MLAEWDEIKTSDAVSARPYPSCMDMFNEILCLREADRAASEFSGGDAS
jgi:hypothetical protein